MTAEHRALIHWSAAQVERGLPETAELIDPAWFDGEPPNVDEAWSLVCHFDSPPASQGSPSAARVHFIMEAAPHDRLHAGASLRLFERGTAKYARVEILD